MEYSDLLNSNFLSVIATIFAALAAYIIWIFQKRSDKRDIAQIILMEIRNAEKNIISMNGNKILNPDIILLPTNNWVRKNYLFINDLDTDEFDLINNFYNKCSLIDKSLSQLDTGIQLDQKSNHIQNKLSEIALNVILEMNGAELVQIRKEFNKRRDIFLEIIEREPHVVSWDSPKSKTIETISKIEKITTSTAGTKLKKIAQLI